MSLSQPKVIHGVHSLTLYNRTTKQPYGILKILGNLSFALSGQSVKLFGGSSPFPWEAEGGTIESSLSGTVKEFSPLLLQRLLGASVTTNSAETSGNVGTLTNCKGTSVMSATTGIASATVIPTTGAANLKSGLYAVVCTEATKVKVYGMSDVDFAQGTDLTFVDDNLLVDSEQTITTAGTHDLAGIGVRLTGGSGTIGMTAGDSAYFLVRKINAGNVIVDLGASPVTFPEFGAFVTSQQQSSGTLFDMQLYRCRGFGVPIPLQEKNFMNSDITIECLYDSTENKVATFRHITGA
jgi:hypothetical protein